ncbi:MAG: type II toxin-antitoxin system HipA family toxin [Solirubrobacteraceae bacterium]
MADIVVDVIVQIGGDDIPAGRLWAHTSRGVESATFEYLPDYLSRSDSYELDPLLPKVAGQQQTSAGHALFGAFSDAAPDGWGRRLIRREEIRSARAEHRTPRATTEVDFLLGVRDDLRQGALRFWEPGTGTFLAAASSGVPHLIRLPRLLNAAEQLEHEDESDEDLRLLLEGGSSLGGARPKAHVEDQDGALGIAKFPAPAGDEWDVTSWEAVALTLAHDAGITIPTFKLEIVAGKPVLIVRRFDRSNDERIGYVSAMTMLEASDGDQGSYVEIAEAVEEHSPSAAVDLRQLWRRIVFSRLISNTDDHLRNHGFLRTSTAGWSLSPAFDLNPNPQPGGKRFSTAVDHGRDTDDDLIVALEVAELFRLRRDDALNVLAETLRVTSQWRVAAKAVGLPMSEIERMSGAFESASADTAQRVVSHGTAAGR